MRFLCDENFNNDILRALFQRSPAVDVIRAQDTEIYQADDMTVLTWAAQQERILLTHDVRTMPGYAYERVAAGLPMPGIIEVSQRIGIGEAIDALLLLIEAGIPADFDNQVVYVPLR